MQAPISFAEEIIACHRWCRLADALCSRTRLRAALRVGRAQRADAEALRSALAPPIATWRTAVFAFSHRLSRTRVKIMTKRALKKGARVVALRSTPMGAPGCVSVVGILPSAPPGSAPLSPPLLTHIVGGETMAREVWERWVEALTTCAAQRVFLWDRAQRPPALVTAAWLVTAFEAKSKAAPLPALDRWQPHAAAPGDAEPPPAKRARPAAGAAVAALAAPLSLEQRRAAAAERDRALRLELDGELRAAVLGYHTVVFSFETALCCGHPPEPAGAAAAAAAVSDACAASSTESGAARAIFGDAARVAALRAMLRELRRRGVALLVSVRQGERLGDGARAAAVRALRGAALLANDSLRAEDVRLAAQYADDRALIDPLLRATADAAAPYRTVFVDGNFDTVAAAERRGA